MIRIRNVLTFAALGLAACGGSTEPEVEPAATCEAPLAPGPCTETHLDEGLVRTSVVTRSWDGERLLTEIVADGRSGAIRSRLVQTWSEEGLLLTRATEKDGVVEAIESFAYEGGLVSHAELDRLGDGLIERRTRYVYDGSGREVGAFFDEGADGTEETSHHRSFDAAGRLAWEEDRTGEQVSVRTEYRYDLQGNCTSKVAVGGDGSPVESVEYRYDEQDRLAEERISAVGEPAEVWLYFYDSETGWLWRKELSGGSFFETYTRDCAGNILYTEFANGFSGGIRYDYACF